MRKSEYAELFVVNITFNLEEDNIPDCVCDLIHTHDDIISSKATRRTITGTCGAVGRRNETRCNSRLKSAVSSVKDRARITKYFCSGQSNERQVRSVIFTIILPHIWHPKEKPRFVESSKTRRVAAVGQQLAADSLGNQLSLCE